MTEHIAILSHKSVLDKILSGEKTVESRFSRVKSLPFGQVAPGDTVYFKLSGGPVLGQARIAAVQEYDNLTPALVESLAKRYQSQLAISVDFLARKLESKFASLLFLQDVQACQPWTYKQDGRSGWIVLEPGELTRSVSKGTPLTAIDENNITDFRVAGLK